MSNAADLTTHVAQRTDDGVFVGHDGSAWLYRVLPEDALQWEDSDVRQGVARRMATLFTELGMHSHLPPPGVRSLRNNQSGLREFHLLSLMADVLPVPPEPNPAQLRAYQQQLFDEARAACSSKLTVFGVRLRRAGISRVRGLRSHMNELADSVIGHEIDLSPYATDRTLIGGIVRKAGGRPPTQAEARRMEFWWNGSRRSDSLLTVSADGRSISCGAWPEGLQFQAVIGFENAQMDPGAGLWLNDVFSANEGCVCVSVRGDVFPSSGVNALFRKTRRKARTAMEENLATGDVDRGEDRELAAAAAELEDFYRESGEPVLRNCSTVFARVASEATHTYADLLNTRWGLEVKTFELRQAQALQETLPCGPTRSRFEKPFSHDVSIGTLAASGITSFSSVGDDEGVWIGMALSDSTPIWVDPGGASKANTPPAMLVVGESGSGKTFLLQLLATQAAEAGFPVVFINPKPADSLSGFAHAVNGEVVRMSSSEHNPGALDPFRFARTPQDAAAIAAAHVKAVLSLGQMDELHLDSGLLKAANEGARCVGEALNHPMIDDDTRDSVRMLCEGQPLFAQGVSFTPRPRMGLVSADAMSEGGGSLTLVEFDRQLTLPQSMDRTHHSREETLGMAAVQLVCTAALESMFAAGGGVLIVDEAHVLMGSNEVARRITRLGREGRSQRILPVLATQLLADVVEGDSNMVSHLSRVCVLKMRDPREAEAALRLLKLEPTEERLGWLAAAGPIRGERGSLGLFRDLRDRVSGFTVGPIPKSTEMLFSTNPLDREMRERSLL